MWGLGFRVCPRLRNSRKSPLAWAGTRTAERLDVGSGLLVWVKGLGFRVMGVEFTWTCRI